MTGVEAEKFEAEVRAGLSGVNVEHPAMKAVLRMLDRQGEIETAGAIAAGLTNEARQFNAGRAAGVLDLAAMVRAEIPKGESGKD